MNLALNKNVQTAPNGSAYYTPSTPLLGGQGAWYLCDRHLRNSDRRVHLDRDRLCYHDSFLFRHLTRNKSLNLTSFLFTDLLICANFLLT